MKFTFTRFNKLASKPFHITTSTIYCKDMKIEKHWIWEDFLMIVLEGTYFEYNGTLNLVESNEGNTIIQNVKFCPVCGEHIEVIVS